MSYNSSGIFFNFYDKELLVLGQGFNLHMLISFLISSISKSLLQIKFEKLVEARLYGWKHCSNNWILFTRAAAGCVRGKKMPRDELKGTMGVNINFHLTDPPSSNPIQGHAKYPLAQL